MENLNIPMYMFASLSTLFTYCGRFSIQFILRSPIRKAILQIHAEREREKEREIEGFWNVYKTQAIYSADTTRIIFKTEYTHLRYNHYNASVNKCDVEGKKKNK